MLSVQNVCIIKSSGLKTSVFNCKFFDACHKEHVTRMSLSLIVHFMRFIGALVIIRRSLLSYHFTSIGPVVLVFLYAMHVQKMLHANMPCRHAGINHTNQCTLIQ